MNNFGDSRYSDGQARRVIRSRVTVALSSICWLQIVTGQESLTVSLAIAWSHFHTKYP